MPNWCENNLIVSGEKSELDKFKKEVQGTGWDSVTPSLLDFNQIIPMPQEVIDEGYDESGYSWETANWGCKWGAHEVDFYESDKALHYYFETPWSPPEPILLAMGDKYSKLDFRLEYTEYGMNFQGEIYIEQGVPHFHNSEDIPQKKLHEVFDHELESPLDYPDCPLCQELIGDEREQKIRKDIEEEYVDV